MGIQADVNIRSYLNLRIALTSSKPEKRRSYASFPF